MSEQVEIDLSESAEPKKARRFCLLFSGVATLGVLLIAALNLIVDPSGELETRIIEPTSLQTRHITMEQLAKCDPATSTLVLGSSRAMRVAPESLNKFLRGPAYNAAVYGGGPHDFHAFYGLAKAEGLTIRDVVIGLDLERFSPTATPRELLFRNEKLRAHIPAEFLSELSTWSRYDELLSFDMARESFKILRSELSGNRPEAHYVMLENGVLGYPRADREIAAGSFDAEASARTTVAEYRGIYAGFDQLNDSMLACLWAFFDRCDADGVRVHCFLTPMHPIVIAALKESVAFAELRDAFVAEVSAEARRRGYRFFDASEIANFAGDAQYFYDGAHPRSENIELVLEQLFAMPYGVTSVKDR